MVITGQHLETSEAASWPAVFLAYMNLYEIRFTGLAKGASHGLQETLYSCYTLQVVQLPW